MRSHASARVSSQYGCCSRVSLGVALSTCTCTRAGTALPPVRDAARRISVSVSRFTDVNLSRIASCSRFAVQGAALPTGKRLQGQSIMPTIRRYATYTLHWSMFLKHLECSACGVQHHWSRLQNLCVSCHKPLLAIVDLAAASRTLTRETLATREKSLWRYREVLPLPGDVEPVSLGEGGTLLLRATKFADDIDLWIKDESLNPTQSFKARGMSVAVSMAKH